MTDNPEKTGEEEESGDKNDTRNTSVTCGTV